MPVILCSEFSHVMDATQAQALGIEAFLTKSVEENELVAII
ncbi:MAG: hypothetical protein ETSY1_32530 [Candidatus Entotheonella factor]|uniref:Response regulatory domain-containing protein n=1 Tax=Entotheonella factor TaxID=1429438 RepID=W4LAE8_ENTF1|nr:MAG: hypothetical protein ETSY1_32530 [Candidatus Entotheonella factor]